MAVPKARTASLLSRSQSKFAKRRNFRFGVLAANILVVVVIAAVVLQHPGKNTSAAPALLSDNSSSTENNPVDQLSSADIALTVARMDSLPEATAVSNQAQSQAAETAIAASSNNVVNKPQVVQTALKSSADIKDYVVQAGDTVASIAAKFGVTSESIRWSNGLKGDSVSPGVKLSIPPVNGIVYVVNGGDTADSLAAKFHADKAKIIAYNDAEITGLTPGQRIIIPDAIQTGPPADPHKNPILGSFAWGVSPVYGTNGYDYGYCTWYVASRISVPANWGNANTWAYYAPSAGWRVSKVPGAGAIAQTSAGAEGHVAIVDAVSADGTMIKYSDMNGLAGWGRVGTTTDWVPATHFQNYISR